MVEMNILKLLLRISLARPHQNLRNEHPEVTFAHIRNQATKMLEISILRILLRTSLARSSKCLKLASHVLLLRKTFMFYVVLYATTIRKPRCGRNAHFTENACV